MRNLLVLLPLAAALASCGGEAEETKAEGPVDALAPGQYAVTETVTEFRQADEGTPALDMPTGTSVQRSVCLPAGSPTNPELFAPEGMTCTDSGSAYIRGGTINATFNCTHADISGDIGLSVNGNFEAETFEAERRLTTALAGEGDVVVESRLEGRRTGECAPAAAPGAEGANAAAPVAAE